MNQYFVVEVKISVNSGALIIYRLEQKTCLKVNSELKNSNHLLSINASIYVYLFLYLFYIYLSIVYSLGGHVFGMTLILRCKN